MTVKERLIRAVLDLPEERAAELLEELETVRG